MMDRRVFLGTLAGGLERAVVHIPDVQVDPEYQLHAVSRASLTRHDEQKNLPR
jgi:hypothetical protein